MAIMSSYHPLLASLVVFSTSISAVFGFCSTLHCFDLGNLGAYGVVGNGDHDDTGAVQALLDVVPENSTVWIPDHMVVLTGPLNLSTTSYLTLRVDGVLLALDISSDDAILSHTWPQIEPLVNYGFSDDLNRYQQYQALIYAANVQHLHITGRGTIDGRGQHWWNAFHNQSAILLAGRPNLVQLVNASHVEIDSVTLRDSPFWTVHPVLCNHVYIHHTAIRAPLYAPNVDGIDPDSCHHVLIEHNDVACGDDHIAIKAGLCAGKGVLDCTDPVWSSGMFSTSNITVQFNTFRTGMGIAVGSESSGSIRQVRIENNRVGVCAAGHDPRNGCGWGPALHLKTTISRGGFVEDIVFANNQVYNTSMFMFLEMSYQSNSDEPAPTEYAPTVVRNIVFDSNEALGSAVGAQFVCSAHDSCRQVVVTNNTIHNANGRNPWECQNIQDFAVHGNVPSGLEECMENSMNSTIANLPITAESTDSK